MKVVTIIGAGISGTLLAINLIKNHKECKLKINLVEREINRFNTGIAYSTNELEHLLNVRVAGMSLFQNEPDHFYNWLISNGYNYQKTDFVSRKIFGNYIKYIFRDYELNKSSDIIINIVKGEVTNIEYRGIYANNDSNYKISFEDEKSNFYSDVVVLAMGNISTAEVKCLEDINSDNYFRTPWTSSLYDNIQSSDKILIIGNGLTSADIILSLKSRLHLGKIYSISRRGFLPISHKIIKPYPSFYEELKGKDINQIFSIVKKHLKGSDEPRAVIDSLRPHTQTIWKSLSEVDKSRFLRHLNHYWNIIRHRAPESTAEMLNDLSASNELEILIGKIDSIEDKGNYMEVKYQDTVEDIPMILKVHKIINCIGPESNYNKIKMPLIQNLLESGLIISNETGISIKANELNVTNDSKYNQLFGIEPIMKGDLFESTAVPEIRVQADVLSNKILNLVQDLV